MTGDAKLLTIPITLARRVGFRLTSAFCGSSFVTFVAVVALSAECIRDTGSGRARSSAERFERGA